MSGAVSSTQNSACRHDMLCFLLGQGRGRAALAAGIRAPLLQGRDLQHLASWASPLIQVPDLSGLLSVGLGLPLLEGGTGRGLSMPLPCFARSRQMWAPSVLGKATAALFRWEQPWCPSTKGNDRGQPLHVWQRADPKPQSIQHDNTVLLHSAPASPRTAQGWARPVTDSTMHSPERTRVGAYSRRWARFLTSSNSTKAPGDLDQCRGCSGSSPEGLMLNSPIANLLCGVGWESRQNRAPVPSGAVTGSPWCVGSSLCLQSPPTRPGRGWGMLPGPAGTGRWGQSSTTARGQNRGEAAVSW